MELEGEVRRMAQAIDELQRRWKAPSWRIMLDNESPFSEEIMNTVTARKSQLDDLAMAIRSMRSWPYWTFLKGRGGAAHAIIAIDYFTKWVEVEALSSITDKKTTDFIWRNIMCRYGIPCTLIADNSKQFDNNRFRGFCKELRIELKFSSPAHPQANRQVEAVNKTIKRLLKTRLGERKGAWVDE